MCSERIRQLSARLTADLAAAVSGVLTRGRHESVEVVRASERVKSVSLGRNATASGASFYRPSFPISCCYKPGSGMRESNNITPDKGYPRGQGYPADHVFRF